MRGSIFSFLGLAAGCAVATTALAQELADPTKPPAFLLSRSAHSVGASMGARVDEPRRAPNPPKASVITVLKPQDIRTPKAVRSAP
ncbi:MAG: hypothetical protein ABIU95_11595 [Burkholderiales bacterium]